MATPSCFAFHAICSGRPLGCCERSALTMTRMPVAAEVDVVWLQTSVVKTGKTEADEMTL